MRDHLHLSKHIVLIPNQEGLVELVFCRSETDLVIVMIVDCVVDLHEHVAENEHVLEAFKADIEVRDCGLAQSATFSAGIDLS